jgi:hypothetical protein
VQILNCSLQKRSRYLQALFLLWGIVYLDHITRMSKNEGIYLSSNKFGLELTCTIIHDFASRDWFVFLYTLSNPVEDLLLAIVVEGDRLSSLSGLIQPMREDRLDTRSWTVECLVRALMETGIL